MGFSPEGVATGVVGANEQPPPVAASLAAASVSADTFRSTAALALLARLSVSRVKASRQASYSRYWRTLIDGFLLVADDRK